MGGNFMKKTLSNFLALFLALLLLPTVTPMVSAANVTADDMASLASSAQQAIGKSASDLGLPAGDWCGYFVVNRMNNSQISTKLGITPYNVCAYAISLVSWICATKDAGVFYAASPVHQNRLLEIDPRLGSNGRMVARSSSGWTPIPGDILQFSWSNWSLHTFDHTGIVVSVNGNTITYVDGNSSAGRVAAHTIRKDSSTIIGHIRFNMDNALPPSNPPQYFNCDVRINCVYGQVVNLCNNPGDTVRSDYFSLGQSSLSTYGVKLSDGSTWYRITANSLGVDKTFWLKYESGKMTITDDGSDTTGRTSAPSVTVDGQTVNISWSYSASTSTIDVYLLQSPWRWEDIRYHKSTTSNTCTFHNVAPGSYQAFTIVRPNTDYVQSEWTKFTVSNSHTTHAWNNGVVTKEPSLTSTGLRKYTCTLCGQTKEETIPDLDVYSGTGSNGVEWTLSKDGTLTVSNPRGIIDTPFYNMRVDEYAAVKRIIIAEGITALSRNGNFGSFPNLSSVELPSTLKTIEYNVFKDCPLLNSIYIPENVSSLGDVFGNPFQNSTGLKNITVSERNSVYQSVDGIVYTKDKTDLVCCAPAREGAIVIPEGVKKIDNAAFLGCSKLSSITIPKSVTFIGTIPSNVLLRVYRGSYAESYAKQESLKYEVINECAIGHTWDGGRVTTAPTTASPGVRTYTCTICKATRTEAIPALTAGGLQNFVDSKEYHNGLFRDVAAIAWYSDNVASVYRLGLMKGTGTNTFAPGKNVTIAETVTLAARLHSIYHTGKEVFESYDGGNWYDPYVNYARNNGIISENYNFNLPATRETFAHILAQALPLSALQPVSCESIHFADVGHIVYAGDVDLLCKAGVINGVQSDGVTNFLPQDTITRAEASAIVTRMAKPELRIK